MDLMFLPNVLTLCKLFQVKQIYEKGLCVVHVEEYMAYLNCEVQWVLRFYNEFPMSKKKRMDILPQHSSQRWTSQVPVYIGNFLHNMIMNSSHITCDGSIIDTGLKF